MDRDTAWVGRDQNILSGNEVDVVAFEHPSLMLFVDKLFRGRVKESDVSFVNVRVLLRVIEASPISKYQMAHILTHSSHPRAGFGLLEIVPLHSCWFREDEIALSTPVQILTAAPEPLRFQLDKGHSHCIHRFEFLRNMKLA